MKIDEGLFARAFDPETDEESSIDGILLKDVIEYVKEFTASGKPTPVGHHMVGGKIIEFSKRDSG